MYSRIIITLLAFVLISCSPEEKSPVTIAINPWPGYELLYLAEKKKFFSEVGANVKLLQLGSLADAQRAYLNGYADGFTSTLIESVQAQVLGSEPLNIVMVTDYSSGADVIVAGKDIDDVSQLLNRNVGAEVSSLGIFMLQRALEKSALSLDDVNLINVEQSEGKSALAGGKIDAFVSYPPVSIEILKNKDYHSIFTSNEIPKEVIDVVSISKSALKNNPELVRQLHDAWKMAQKYYVEFPEEAIEIMAARENISPQDFQAILQDELVILDIEEQKALLQPDGQLEDNLRSVCEALVHVGSLETDCVKLPNMLYKLKN